MVVLGGLFVWALLGSPDAVTPGAPPIEPVPLDLTPRPPPARPRAELETRRGRSPAQKLIRDLFGPAPHPDIAGHHERDDVKVTVEPDGTAKAKSPRAVRGAAGVCLHDRCATTRGIRSVRSRPEAPEHGALYSQSKTASTAPKMARIIFAFGWQPPSPKAAATMLKASSQARARLAVAWQTRALEDARRGIGRRLAAIVRDRSLSPADKRRIVFELWDDAVLTAAEPVSDGDALGLARASAARSVADAIERFVRRSMPRGSALGYEPSDLAELDAMRRGPRRFEPYRGDS